MKEDGGGSLGGGGGSGGGVVDKARIRGQSDGSATG